MHKQANTDRSYMKAGKLDSAGVMISHTSISPLYIPSEVLVQLFMCQYGDNPEKTVLQPECIMLYDL